MRRSDPMQDLRDVYEMWSQFKQSVVDWFQTNGWLIELGVVGVVGFIVVVMVGVVILAVFLIFIGAVGKPIPAASIQAYWEERKKQQEAERRKRLDTN
jgi:hypothetical protein